MTAQECADAIREDSDYLKRGAIGDEALRRFIYAVGAPCPAPASYVSEVERLLYEQEYVYVVEFTASTIVTVRSSRPLLRQEVIAEAEDLLSDYDYDIDWDVDLISDVTSNKRDPKYDY